MTPNRTSCERPGRGASKADMLEWHKERVRNRMARRRVRQSSYSPNAWLMAGGKNGDPDYRKRIWPEGKTARPGRMG